MKVIIRPADPADEKALSSLYDWFDHEAWLRDAAQISLGSTETPDKTMSGALHEFLTVVGIAKGALDISAIVATVGEWIRAHRHTGGVVLEVENGAKVTVRNADPETLAVVAQLLAGDTSPTSLADGGSAGT